MLEDETFREKQPLLATNASVLWETYWAVSPSRIVHAGGPGCVPLSEILAYFEIIEEDDIDRRLWILQVVAALDDVYLKYVAERNATISGSGAKG